MSEFAVDRPLDEADPDHERGSHPVRAHARQSDRSGEGRASGLERIESRAEPAQQAPIEASADFAGVDEAGPVGSNIADEQRPEADPTALRIGEPADDEL